MEYSGKAIETPLKKTAPSKPHYHGHRNRLRKKMLTHADGLADYELLELILAQALPRGDVKPLAKELMRIFGSFADVLTANPIQMMQVKGVGEAVIIAIKIAHQASLRLVAEKMDAQNIISSWQAVLDYCRVHMAYGDREQFCMICLDQRNHVIDYKVIQTGTINHVTLYPREIVKQAFDKGATALIIVHNHPSGSPEPSQGDIDFTKKLHHILKPLDIALHDHIIITRSKHFSFRENGLLVG